VHHNTFVKQLFRWSGALVFLLSLLSMPAMYLFRWGQPAAPSDTAVTDAIVNVALFTVFALHHSIMARSGAKGWITSVVPADLERSVYVWIASLLFLAVCLLWRSLPGIIWDLRGPALILYAIQLSGGALTLAAARIVGVWELAGVTQPDPSAPIEFKAAGPFAIVRHPIYLGWALMVFATPAMTISRLLFAVISTLYLIAAIPLEERSLVEAYGEKYREYQRQMRWRLMPGVW
jgi:protein-S-isoprenylcysteine O-methyltransferase Ste14